jgi:RNA polymerase-binding transcription factor DksA
MTRKELEEYRERLMALGIALSRDRSRLKEEALRTAGGEASGGFSDVPIHLADLGSHHFEEEISLTLLENQELFLEEINKALARIEDGTFGRCEGCRKPISPERLRVLPYARYCVNCARGKEGEAGR